MTPAIEKVWKFCAVDLAALVAESEELGFQFLRRLVDDWTANTNRFDRPGEALFAAHVAEEIVGVCGLNIDPYLGDPRIGRVRHLYVLVEYRRRGLGRQLMERVIAAATGVFCRLSLKTDNPDASRLHEAIGFSKLIGETNHTHVMILPTAVEETESVQRAAETEPR